MSNTQIKDGGPAFPRGSDAFGSINDGMSLRDWFAGMALPNVMSESNASKHTIKDVATVAYVFADEMLAAREVKP